MIGKYRTEGLQKFIQLMKKRGALKPRSLGTGFSLVEEELKEMEERVFIRRKVKS